MTDRVEVARERACKLADEWLYGNPLPTPLVITEFVVELRAAFEAGYLACMAEDDEPQGDDVVLRCYHPSGTWDLIRRFPLPGRVACWAINGTDNVTWSTVLAKGYVRRVQLIEEGSGS